MVVLWSPCASNSILWGDAIFLLILSYRVIIFRFNEVWIGFGEITLANDSWKFKAKRGRFDRRWVSMEFGAIYLIVVGWFSFFYLLGIVLSILQCYWFRSLNWNIYWPVVTCSRVACDRQRIPIVICLVSMIPILLPSFTRALWLIGGILYRCT